MHDLKRLAVFIIGAVHMRQGMSHRTGNIQSDVSRQRAHRLQHMLHIRPINVLEHMIRQALELPVVEQLHDVLVVEVREHPRFINEARASLSIAGQGRPEALEDQQPIGTLGASQDDLGRPALSEGLERRISGRQLHDLRPRRRANSAR